MTTSSGAAPPRLLGHRLQDLPVRRLSVADLAACSDLAESRGWGREEHKWRLLLTAGQGYGIDAPDRRGALIGTCVLTSYPALPAAAGPGRGADAEAGGAAAGPRARARAGAGAEAGEAGRAAASGAACVGMMLVAERCARQGLGRRLLEHTVAAAGDALLFLSATEGGRPLYERLGFRPYGTVTSLTGRFRLPADEEFLPPDGTAPSVRPAKASDLAAVRALDAPVFGADRTRLLLRLRQFADRFVVAEDRDGSLRGFAASWPNGPLTTVVGPVVAEDTETAQALVRDLGRHAPGTFRLDIAAHHVALDAWARRHGLDGRFLCTSMARTRSGLPGDGSRRFVPYSVALG